MEINRFEKKRIIILMYIFYKFLGSHFLASEIESYIVRRSISKSDGR